MNPSGAGRYAPSPSGDLHLGNVRTAMLAWAFARSTGRQFLMRVEDLDRVAAGSEQRQLADLAAIGIDWDGPVVRQSERRDLFEGALAELTARNLTYPCFCTRREIKEAASAPHPGDDPAAELAYPGTCRDLDPADRRRRAAERPAALRLRADVDRWTVQDRFAGTFTGRIDDVVLRRNDGVPAYNLAVVVDDAAQGVDQVVRGADLLTSAPRQAHLASLLGLAPVEYAHVPMVLGPTGARLAKRDGAVTLTDLQERGWSVDQLRSLLASSLGWCSPGESVTMPELLERWNPDLLPTTPWVLDPATLLAPPD